MEKNNTSSVKRITLVIAAVIVGIALILGIALAVFIGVMRLPVSSYYRASEKAFIIPGLHDRFVPQGFCYDEAREHFIVSGYSSEKEASSVYLVNRSSGETVKRIFLAKANGEAFKGHAGGIDFYGDFVYVAGSTDNCLYVYSYPELLNAEDGASIGCIGRFSLEVSKTDFVRASFVTVHGDTLTVGEFYSESLAESHQMAVDDGKIHGAIAVSFPLSDDEELGIVAMPTRVYSLPEKVQGICFDGDDIYLSTSYGLSHSYIYEFDSSKLSEKKKVKILGHDLPVYYLDTVAMTGKYKAPPMAEEAVMIDGRFYVMCESASQKYIFGKFTGGKWCYKTDLDQMK